MGFFISGTSSSTKNIIKWMNQIFRHSNYLQKEQKCKNKAVSWQCRIICHHISLNSIFRLLLRPCCGPFTYKHGCSHLSAIHRFCNLHFEPVTLTLRFLKLVTFYGWQGRLLNCQLTGCTTWLASCIHKLYVCKSQTHITECYSPKLKDKRLGWTV